MRIGIIGAEPIGDMIASQLARAGHEVTVGLAYESACPEAE